MSGGTSPNAALVLIDVQNDFCPGGSLAVAGGDEIIPVINRLSPGYPIVVATRDWHPVGHVSFASSHPGRKAFESVRLAGGEEQVLWPDHCLQGSEGANFHPDLDTRPIHLILHKGTTRPLDSYSAFFENDHLTPTGLEYYLRGLDCRELHFCGIATDVCVYFSVMDALKLGFQCTVIIDAIRGVDVPSGSAQRAIDAMAAAGATAVSSKAVRG